MFKLESYITPIILSHVEKYVKNVKAEQSQVSGLFYVLCTEHQFANNSSFLGLFVGRRCLFQQP